MSRAFLARARASDNASSKLRFAIGDQVRLWRGNNKKKAAWAMRWVGPGIMTGHEGDANVWMAEFGKQVPWHDLYDELSGQTADDGTFYDLTSPGSSREPLAGPAVPPRMPGQGFQEPPRVLPSVDPVDMRDSSVQLRDDIAAPSGKRSRRSDADMLLPPAAPTHWTPGPPQPSDSVPTGSLCQRPCSRQRRRDRRSRSRSRTCTRSESEIGLSRT